MSGNEGFVMNDTPMITRRRLFDECCTMLRNAGKDSPDFDTLCIFQDMLGEKNPLFLPGEAVPPEAEKRIRTLVRARSEGSPLQYLLGKWEFYGIELYVGEGVLIPRPDTETLVEHTLELCREKGMNAPVIAELCSGSGCISLALEKELPQAEIYAAEVSEKALGYLRKNCELNHSHIHIVEADILAPESLKTLPEADIIVSNPPYLTDKDMSELEAEVLCEPALALYGGSDGLDFYRAITGMWREKLRECGLLAFEFGMGQHGDVERILRSSGFTDISFRRDGGGIIRTAAAVKR